MQGSKKDKSMVKRTKLDESGDNDELQALFDSIAPAQATAKPPARPARPPFAAVPPRARAAAAPITPVATKDTSGDSDELQSLFDSVAHEFSPAPAKFSPPPPPEYVGPDPMAVFMRLGKMTRQVHDTLRELGFDQALHEVAEVIPDTRQRLTYIAQMTEQAASRVLNATDIAQPIQEKLHHDAVSLQESWARLLANQLSVDDFKVLVQDTRAFLDEAADGSKATSTQLLEIMMAQDFQDLTGQVIKKVVEMAQTLETQLLQVLLEVTPAEKRTEQHAGLMNGPVINADGRDDVVNSQEQVDDLLESLGF
jgi:chemotaxis protein CheZ